jgi:hypothetical protein
LDDTFDKKLDKKFDVKDLPPPGIMAVFLSRHGPKMEAFFISANSPNWYLNSMPSWRTMPLRA